MEYIILPLFTLFPVLLTICVWVTGLVLKFFLVLKGRKKMVFQVLPIPLSFLTPVSRYALKIIVLISSVF